MIRLILASDYQYGQELLQNKNFDDFGGFLSEMYFVFDLIYRFELGRRHKIMNPDKMRETYGKLMYLLQDS